MAARATRAGGDARLDEGLEVALAAEGVRLAAIEAEHRLVDGEAGEGFADHALRNAGGLRVARHGVEEGVEVAAAFGGLRRRGDHEHEDYGQRASDHAEPRSI